MTQLTIEDFGSWVGGECQIASQGERLTMTLAVAEPLANSLREGGGFRLEFAGPAEPVLSQGIAEVAGPSGTHDIFIVPVARDTERTLYEAIFC